MEKLSKYNEQLLKDYQEIHEKYAEVVGHHNHRQRIKHVSQLKDKINQLEQVHLTIYLGINHFVLHVEFSYYNSKTTWIIII